MNISSQKVLIKLVDAGSRQDKVLAVLSKIQGLRDIPENLITRAPCYISGNVPLEAAEEVKKYLERAGAVVEFDIEEKSLTPSEPERPETQDVTGYKDEDAASFGIDDDYSEEDASPQTSASQANYDYSQAGSESQFVHEFAEASSAEPQPRRRKSGEQRLLTPQVMTIGGGILLTVLVIGMIWMYATGKFSHVARQYTQNPIVGQAGVLIIENDADAELSLQQVIGTRVFAPVSLENAMANLQQGDYYVEARKDFQLLRYPVYIKGRGHRLKVVVSFPDPRTIPEDMAYIPAGWFRMGNKETEVAHFGFPDEKPDIDVYVSAFLMSKYEVTNRDYARFVNAGGYDTEVYWESLITDWDSLTRQVPDYERVFGNDGWNSVRQYIRTSFINTDDKPGPRLWEDDTPPYEYGQDNHPVMGVTLYEAEAYCKWLSQQTGKVHRLPTEAEWEKAARGYEGYFFAYGNEYDPTRGNTETEGPQDVGSYPPNGFGVYDLTGNVWEWVVDHYRDDAYQYLADQYKNDIRNPKVFDEAHRYNRRIVRGGSFRSVNRVNAKATIRYPMFPNYWHTNIGFRYVTTP